MRPSFLHAALIGVAPLFLFACRAAPAPDAGFIAQPERMTKPVDMPFYKAWIKPGVEVRKDYSRLYVAPVNTQYLLEMDWWDRESPRVISGEFHKDVEDLAVYTRESLMSAFENDENHRFQVVDGPAAGVAVLEMALIEVVPSKAVLNAIGWLPPIGTGALFSALSPRTVAFEARIRDGGTNEVIATFADREKQPAGPLDVSRLTWYGPAQSIIDEWADELVEIANRKPGEIISEPAMFTLMPW